jgi:hypothetical protein
LTLEVGMQIALRNILLLCSIVVASSAAGQQAEPPLDGPKRTFQDPLFEQLTGTWTMAGAVRARPATYSLRVEWTLNHQFLRLEMRDVSEPPAYQAAVYIGYDNTSERYVMHWLDAFGGRFSETSDLENGTATRCSSSLSTRTVPFIQPSP